MTVGVERVERSPDGPFALLVGRDRSGLVSRPPGEVVAGETDHDAVVAVAHRRLEEGAVAVVYRAERAGDGDAHGHSPSSNTTGTPAAATSAANALESASSAAKVS